MHQINVKKAGVVVAGSAALAFSGAPGAQAGVSFNTIDGHVTYKRGGALVRSSGPIGCTRGERIAISVSVSQAAMGARARESWAGRCTGEVQRWQVRAKARTDARFAKGTARVCAVAETRAAQRVTDARRWCRRASVSAGF